MNNNEAQIKALELAMYMLDTENTHKNLITQGFDVDECVMILKRYDALRDDIKAAIKLWEHGAIKEATDNNLYEYGYTVCTKNECKKFVLGSVSQSEYDEKKREINDANAIENTKFDDKYTNKTVWFIDAKQEN